MIKKDSIKKILLFFFTLTLIAIAVSMFYLQNIYLPKISASEKVTVYIANKDISPLTEIKEEDFTAIKLPATAISSDYVVKMSDVTGGVAKNTIYQKEILAFSHIAEEGYTPDKNLLTTVVPKYYDNIQPGDLVNVYVAKADKKEKTFSIETVFIAKKVEKVTDEEETVKTNAKNNFAFSIIVSEEELKSYYAADYAGDIIATKIVNPSIANIISTLTHFNPDEVVFNTIDDTAEEAEETQQ
jgi:hypothetical protein